MRMVRELTLAVLVTMLAPLARAQTAAPAPPSATAPGDAAAPAKLTGLAAWERLKGNTVDGKSAGQTVVEFFDAGGGVKYVDKDGLSTGTWAVQKDKVCFDFPDEDDRTCTTFEVTGSSGTAVDDDGETLKFTILPGNAKGL